MNCTASKNSILDTNLSVMKDLGCADLNYIETGIYPLMFLPLTSYGIMPTTPILASSKYESAKKMEYPYIGRDYPKEITLNYPESRTILSKTKVDISCARRY